MLFGCTGCVLLLGAATARAGTVVTDHVVSTVAQAQTNVPVTFGQVFKAGDIPRGETVTATLNGQPVALQVDSKATHPDGSLRHAVLTATVPSLPGNATLPLALSTGAAPATTGLDQPVSLSQLLATSYDADVALNIGGRKYTANARALLQAANSTNACKPWGTQCNQWLSGPQTSEWIVNGPVTAADGTTNPNLRIYFAVRAYADGSHGTVRQVQTDVIVENTSAYTPQAQPQYTATLTSGNEVYTSPALTQYAYTRWHKVLWWNHAEPQVYLQQDTGYIQDSKAVSRYMPLTPDEKFLASLRQTCAPLDHCDQTQKMHMAGAQAAIGPLPRWTSVYIVDPDVRAYNWMLANTDALGAYGIHYRDQATGWPLSIQKRPYVTTTAWTYANGVAKQAMTGSAANQAKIAAYRRDLLPNCTNNAVVTGCTEAYYGTGNPAQWDNAHQPSQSYVPYMVTGSYYYMSELAFAASINALTPNPVYRGYSQGLIDDSYSQVRGKAWVLRQMADAAWLLPDGYPLKAEFNANVNNSLADWGQKYINNPSANSLGLMNSGHSYSVNGGTRNAMAPWMHNFFTWSAGHAAELGFAGAAELRDWLAKFEIGLMTDWQANPTQGYCWLQASAYTLVVTEPTGKTYLPSYSAIYAATFPSLVGLACNSPAMVTAMGTLEKQSWQAGKMHGYPQSATGYPANLQIGLAAAADSAVPNAYAAWSLFESRSVKPSGTTAYNNYPNFAVIPRSAPGGSVGTPPPTTPPPTDPIAPPTDTLPPAPTTGQPLSALFKFVVNGATVSVTDLSVGAVKEQWQWGNGGTSNTVGNQTVTYRYAGTYPVRLIVWGADGKTTDYKSTVTTTADAGSAAPPPPPPAASGLVSASFKFVVNGATVSITDQSVGAVKEQWQWGNGGTSNTVGNQTVTYRYAGTYPIRLIVWGADGKTVDYKATVTTTKNSGTP
jgi:PKD repeat protein